MRATYRQKRLIKRINAGLGLGPAESQAIVNEIRTFREADMYIKKFLPVLKIKRLKATEVREIFLYIINELNRMRIKNV